MTMADEIAVMNFGRIEQRGSATDLYERPLTEFVANFLGISNLIDGAVTRRDGGLAEFTTHDGARVLLPSERLTDNGTGELRVGVRPEKIALVPAETGAPAGDVNVLRGRVAVASFLGVAIQYVIETPGGEELTVIAQNIDGDEPTSVGPGREVLLTWNPHHTFVVHKETAHA